jgi:hypothetical protein
MDSDRLNPLLVVMALIAALVTALGCGALWGIGAFFLTTGVSLFVITLIIAAIVNDL